MDRSTACRARLWHHCQHASRMAVRKPVGVSRSCEEVRFAHSLPPLGDRELAGISDTLTASTVHALNAHLTASSMQLSGTSVYRRNVPSCQLARVFGNTFS